MWCWETFSKTHDIIHFNKTPSIKTCLGENKEDAFWPLLGGATHKCHKKKNLLVLLHLQILITHTFVHPQVFVDPIIQQKRNEFQPAHQRFFNHGSNELTKQGSKGKREQTYYLHLKRLMSSILGSPLPPPPLSPPLHSPSIAHVKVTSVGHVIVEKNIMHALGLKHVVPSLCNTFEE